MVKFESWLPQQCASIISGAQKNRVITFSTVTAGLKESEASDFFWHLLSLLVVQLVRDIETAAAIHGSGAISAGSDDENPPFLGTPVRDIAHAVTLKRQHMSTHDL